MKKIRILSIILIIFLFGCQAQAPDATLSGDPMDINKEQIYYDPIDKKLIKFNPNGNSSEVINKDASSFAYDINNADHLFVLGDSKNHIYKLIKIEGSQMETLHEFQKGEEVIPLGYNGNNIYFIHSFYDKNGEDKNKRIISLIDLSTFEITDIESVDGLLTDGIVSPNNIYYTVYNNENNYYELHRKSIEDGKKSEAPELISVGYQTPELYLSKDLFNEKEIISLYASDEDRIYSKDESWEKFQANYFKPTSVIGIDKNLDGMMNLTFIEKKTRSVTNVVENVVGIRFEGDTIVVATTSGASKY